MKDCVDTRIEGRGVCVVHYKRHERAIKSGKVTWKQLVKIGMALPTKQEVYMYYEIKMREAKEKKDN